jgi:hypothetical protein
MTQFQPFVLFRHASAVSSAVLAVAVCALAAPGAAADARGGSGGGAGGGSVNRSGGDVEVHGESTPSDARSNEPRACVFYLDAFGFGGGERVRWIIGGQPPAGTAPVRVDTMPVDAGGHGVTENMRLPDGRYRLDWSADGRRAGAKIFTVNCGAARSAPLGLPAAGPPAGADSLASTGAEPTAAPTSPGAEPPTAPASAPSAPGATAAPAGAATASAALGPGGRLAQAGDGGFQWIAGTAAVLLLTGSGLVARRRTGRG